MNETESPLDSWRITLVVRVGTDWVLLSELAKSGESGALHALKASLN